IDLDTARQRGITVTNTPGVLTEDTADMSMALVLATARRMGEGERIVRAGKWTGWSPTAMLGARLLGKRMGIVGMGRIGQALARGEVIDENAMVRMLKAGELGGVGLDVYEHEPQVNPKLLELDNVVLLPHMGSATLEGRIEMGEKVLINIKTFADGHKPPDRVLPAML